MCEVGKGGGGRGVKGCSTRIFFMLIKMRQQYSAFQVLSVGLFTTCY